jgi:hypothetical protein
LPISCKVRIDLFVTIKITIRTLPNAPRNVDVERAR